MGAVYRRLTRSVTFSGKGLHSGAECVCRVEPSDTELSLSAGEAFSPLRLLTLEGKGRGSDCIFSDGSRVRTCEHVFSALVGSGIWRAKVFVEGGEMPALDGCAESAAELFFENSEPCSEGPGPLDLPFALRVGDGERFVAAFPAPRFRLTCAVRYASPLVGSQIFDFEGGTDAFRSEVARARTFAMESDIKALRERGMALGGSLDNAILVGNSEVCAQGGLRYPDEFVRHKTLDLIGDLALLGCPLNAHVVAVRAGHALHLRLVEKLRTLIR